MKLATFKSGGQEKIGIVHTGDTLLFDLAAAANRSGSANPAFASMLALIDAGDAALEQAAKVFDQHGKDESLSIETGTAGYDPRAPATYTSNWRSRPMPTDIAAP